jgi:hypothetical protein
MTEHPMVEPVPISEIFASGLGKIEDIGGGCLRLYFYVLQAPLESVGPAERVLVVKVIVPAGALPDMVMEMNGRDESQAGGRNGVDCPGAAHPLTSSRGRADVACPALHCHGRLAASLPAATHAHAVHHDVPASGGNRTYDRCAADSDDRCAMRPDTTSSSDAPGADHGICVGSIVSHGRSERGNGEGDEYEQAHGCLLWW